MEVLWCVYFSGPIGSRQIKGIVTHCMTQMTNEEGKWIEHVNMGFVSHHASFFDVIMTIFYVFWVDAAPISRIHLSYLRVDFHVKRNCTMFDRIFGSPHANLFGAFQHGQRNTNKYWEVISALLIYSLPLMLHIPQTMDPWFSTCKGLRHMLDQSYDKVMSLKANLYCIRSINSISSIS